MPGSAAHRCTASMVSPRAAGRGHRISSTAPYLLDVGGPSPAPPRCWQSCSCAACNPAAWAPTILRVDQPMFLPTIRRRPATNSWRRTTDLRRHEVVFRCLQPECCSVVFSHQSIPVYSHLDSLPTASSRCVHVALLLGAPPLSCTASPAFQ
jgi:hypothetical protein